jgi:hypothetical protein
MNSLLALSNLKFRNLGAHHIRGSIQFGKCSISPTEAYYRNACEYRLIESKALHLQRPYIFFAHFTVQLRLNNAAADVFSFISQAGGLTTKEVEETNCWAYANTQTSIGWFRNHDLIKRLFILKLAYKIILFSRHSISRQITENSASLTHIALVSEHDTMITNQ